MATAAWYRASALSAQRYRAAHVLDQAASAPSAISLVRPKVISSPWAIVMTMRFQAAARQRVDREAHDVGF
jgi:hypothetical protein